MAQRGRKQTDKRNASIDEKEYKMSDERNVIMPEWNNETQVLAFLAEYQIPLKPAEVYGGLIHTGTITFKYRTTQNKLRDLYEAGYADRVQIDKREGRVKTLPDDGEDRRAAYLITDSGLEELERRIGSEASEALVT